MSSGAHVARFLLLYFAQTASPILVLRRGAMLAQTRWSTHAVPVAAGGARRGRFCVNGWKNRLGAAALRVRFMLTVHGRTKRPSGAQ
jgi:hypothetical protein